MRRSWPEVVAALLEARAVADRRNVEELVAALLEELIQFNLEGIALTPDDPDYPELIAVFCRHKRLMRILLTLCDD